MKKWYLPVGILLLGFILRWYELGWPLSMSHTTFHPDEMRMRYAVGDISWIPLYEITEQSLQSLQNEGVPNSIIDRLRPLRDQVIKGNREFLRRVEEQIGHDQIDRHQRLILRHTVWKNLNPRFFAYGSLPIYLMKFVYDAAKTLFPQIDFFLVGRALSACWATLTLIFIYLFGKRFFSQHVALISSAFLAVTVLHIQLAHFLTVDVMLTFLVLLALYWIASLVERPTPIRYYLLSGVAIGLALATKISALPLYGVFLGAHLLMLINVRRTFSATGHPHVLRRFQWTSRHPTLVLWAVFACALLLSLSVFLLCEPYAFLETFQKLESPQNLGDIGDFLKNSFLTFKQSKFYRDLKEQGDMVRGTTQPPYTIQYEHTSPYLYQLKHLVLYSMGLPLGLITVLGTFIIAVQTFIKLKEMPFGLARLHRVTLLILLWFIPVFWIVGGFKVKFLRYMLPLIPFLCLLSAVWLDQIMQRSRVWKRLIAILVLLVFGMSTLYALAFVSIYHHKDPRVRASKWIYDRVPLGSTLLTESWEFAPLSGTDGHHPGQYRVQGLELYHPDSELKIRKLAQQLEQGEAIMLATRRIYGSVLRIPKRFPLTTAYYKLLFDGRLGFTPEQVFTNYPSLPGITFNDDFADESFSVYDHPKSIVFLKTTHLSADQIYRLITDSAPVDNPDNLLKRLLAFPVLEGETVPTEAAKEERVYNIAEENRGQWSQPVSILLWLLTIEGLSLLAFPLTTLVFRNLPDKGYAISKIVGILLPAYGVWLLASLKILPYTKFTILGIIGALFLLALFMVMRFLPFFIETLRRKWRVFLVYERIFLLAFFVFLIIRAYNPDIFWSESSMDFSFLTVLTRTKSLPPPDPWFSGAPLNYYYFGHYLVATLTKLTGIWPQVAYNLAFALFPALVVLEVFSLLYNLTKRYLWGGVGALFAAVLGNLDGFFLLIATWRTHLQFLNTWIEKWPWLNALIGREMYYRTFRSAHEIIPYTVHEFPFWTFLFVDLHAHLMNMPFLLAVFLIGLNILSNEPIPSSNTLRAVSRSRLVKYLTFLLYALLVGTLSVISSWDYPTGVIFLLLLAGVAGCRKLRVFGKTMWQILALIPISLLLYVPFYRAFSRSGMGLGRVGAATTRLSDFFTIFGFFLFLVLSYLVVRLYQSATLRTFWLLLVLGFIIPYGTSALLFSTLQINYMTLFFLLGLTGISVYLSFATRTIPEDLQKPLPDQAFIWCCLIYACLITAGCELVFVKDFLQGGEYKRMNTIFKFYIPAWFLFAIVAAYALFYLHRQWTRHKHAVALSPYFTLWDLTWGWVVIAGALFLMTAVFPVMGTYARRYHDFYNREHLPPTLDGLAFLEVRHPDEARAIHWLNTHVAGTPVILEAVGADYLYEYGRISANTGLPTVLGWPSHADQREHWKETHQRKLDIREIYTSRDMKRVLFLLRQYDVRFAYIGRTERNDFPEESLRKFRDYPEYFESVFESGDTAIYLVQ